MTQKNILIVDDDERLRDLLKDYLTEKKLNVYISDDFENARDVIQYFIFDGSFNEMILWIKGFFQF